MQETKRPKVHKTDEEWRAELSDLEFQVTRKAATEAPFTGEYTNTKTPGTYVCRCCGAELFSANTKYDSSCGWPSFYEPIDNEQIDTKIDRSHFMTRTEALCSNCDAHLGHVFPDGLMPTRQRWCINSASLKLQEETK